MQTEIERVDAFRAFLETGEFPYAIEVIEDNFKSALEPSVNTDFDQDFVDFCIDCVWNRIKRLKRLQELEAPQFITESEYYWLMKNTERLRAALQGSDWSLSEEDQKDLNFQIEIDELSQEE